MEIYLLALRSRAEPLVVAETHFEASKKSKYEYCEAVLQESTTEQGTLAREVAAARRTWACFARRHLLVWCRLKSCTLPSLLVLDWLCYSRSPQKDDVSNLQVH